MQDKYKERLLEELNRQKAEARRVQEEKNKKIKTAILLGFLLIVAAAGGFIAFKLLSKPKADPDNSTANGELIDDIEPPWDGDGSINYAADPDATPTDVASPTEPVEKDFTIDMTFVGDCCMATNLENNSYGTLLWYESNAPTTYFFDGVRSYFEDDDITIANCENTFSDRAASPRDKGEGTNYWFKSPASFASVFSDNSIEAVTINNNHTNDYGPEVFEDTKAALDAAGVEWGFRDKIIYYEEEGFTVGVVCVSFYYYEEAEGIVPYLDIAKENSDFQIIYFHGGMEGEYNPEPWKQDACHMLIDNGADLILGAHPHVLQKTENYNGCDIVYSLGNFCFGGNDHPGSNRTIIYKYQLSIHSVDGECEITAKTPTIIPCYVYTGGTNNWQPAVIDDEETASIVTKFMNGECERPQ